MVSMSAPVQICACSQPTMSRAPSNVLSIIVAMMIASRDPAMYSGLTSCWSLAMAGCVASGSGSRAEGVPFPVSFGVALPVGAVGSSDTEDILAGLQSTSVVGCSRRASTGAHVRDLLPTSIPRITKDKN